MHLLERDPYLTLLHDYAALARAGAGQLVFVGGEMGIGKTSLVDQFRSTLEPAGNVAVVSCDAHMVKGPLGPLFDVAQVLGPEVVSLLASQAPRDELFRAVEHAFANAPGFLVMITEDVHWGDEASLDLLHFLGRRIDRLGVLIVATYRDDEISASHPLRRVLGDLATVPNVQRMILPPLSIDAVRSLASGKPFDPETLLAYTTGNPFFIREILESGLETPVTIQDAVLARVSRLSVSARETLNAASLIGLAIDPDLLTAVIPGSIEAAIEECLARGLLHSTGNEIQFRHAAVRDAVMMLISPIRRLALHKRIYRALQADQNREVSTARLAHHAEEGGYGAEAYLHAMEAATLAVTYKSHQEAAAQYQRALRHAGAQPPAVRADLLEASAYELYLTGRIDDALVAQEHAVALRERIDDALGLGECERKLSRYHWFAGDIVRADVHARRALDLLQDFPESRELARAFSNLSQLRMLAQQVDEAVAWGMQAVALAERLDDQATLAHALTNVGAAIGFLGGEDGYPYIRRAIDVARAADLEDDLVRALTCLGGPQWYRRDLAAARETYTEGIAHAERCDLLAMELYLIGMRANVDLAMGEVERALADAAMVCAHPLAGKTQRFVSLIAVGMARARRGDDGGSELDEALQIALEIGEFQRTGPIRAARAEAAWLRGDRKRAVAEASAVLDLACEVRDPWLTGELAIWLARCNVEVPAPVRSMVAEPYRLEIEGDWQGAAAIWREKGDVLNLARTASHGTDQDELRATMQRLDQLGFRPDAARIAERMRALGFRNVPRGPRPSTRASYAGLTRRELDVLRLMCGDVSNREIANRLYLSSRTVEHHVSAILAKLDVSSREDAARRAQEAGITA